MAQEDVEVKDSGGEGSFIPAVAAKTLYWMVIFAAFVCALGSLLFPRAVMRFYDDLGSDAQAYAGAVRYERLMSAFEGAAAPETSRLLGAYISCFTYASRLMDERAEFAQATEHYTRAYLAAEGSERRTALIDDYRLSHTAQRAAHPGVYSYADYLYTLNYRARLCAGETRPWLFGQETTLEAMVDAIDPADSVRSAVAFSLLTEYLAFGSAIDEALYIGATDKLASLLSALPLDVASLASLYVCKTLVTFVAAAEETALRLGYDVTALDRAATAVVDGAEGDVGNVYYRVLLPRYINAAASN